MSRFYPLGCKGERTTPLAWSCLANVGIEKGWNNVSQFVYGEMYVIQYRVVIRNMLFMELKNLNITFS